MFIRVTEESELATLFFHHLRDRGVHLLEGFPSYVTAAHTDADIDFVIAAAKDAVLEMQADGVLPTREGAPPAAVATPRPATTYPTTDGQRELWVTAQMGERANAALNESDAITIDGPLEPGKLALAVEESINAQEAFRLRFSADGSAQSPDPGATFRVNRLDRSGMGLDRLKRAEATEPFDLEKGPLIRAHLVKLAPEKHVFIVYAHHLVFDGYSAELLLKDIAARYEGKGGLAELVPYGDYARKAANAPERRAALAYWRERLAFPPPPLDLPTDRPFPTRRLFEGATARGRLSAQSANAFKTWAKSAGVGAYAAFLAAYAALTARLTGQEDFVIGAPAAGQANLGLETIGYCVNMLPMRLTPKLSDRFCDFAKVVQRNLVEAMEHQDVCLSDLARDLKTPRDLARPALIQSVFNYSGYFRNMTLGPCKASAAENERIAVHHELFINLTESGEGVSVDWDYSAALFDRETIERWISHLSALIADAAARPGAEIGELALMSNEARDAVVVAMRRGG
jgi:hypothetical protein